MKAISDKTSKFIEFEKSCRKKLCNGVVVYDIKSQCKWLSLSELLDYFVKIDNT